MIDAHTIIVGDTVQLRATPERPRLVRVEHIRHDRYGAPEKLWLRSILHEADDGTLYKPGPHWSIPSPKFWDIAEAVDVFPPHLVMAHRCLDDMDDGTERVKHKRKVRSVVHRCGPLGVQCGATLHASRDLPRRYCDFRKKWLPPRHRRSVWLPTYMPVTCKRCTHLGKQADE